MKNIDWWKYTATAMTSILLTLCLAWLTGASQFVTRQEISRMIDRQAPYVFDREVIQLAITHNTKAINGLAKQTVEIARRQMELQADVKVLLQIMQANERARRLNSQNSSTR